MLETLRDNASLISAFASIATLSIWGIYLHIFVLGYNRQIKPMLIINRGQGRTLDARCLLTNMSREPVHVQSVVAKLITEDGDFTNFITDAEDIRANGSSTDWQVVTRQGPLGAGQMIDLGAYGDILDYAVQNSAGEKTFDRSAIGRRTRAVEISILGIYGSEELLIGASRIYEFDWEKTPVQMRARSAQTSQIRRKRERRRLSRQLAEQL